MSKHAWCVAVACIVVAIANRELNAAVRVSGRVVDLNGRPVVGAKVVLSNASPPLRKAIPVLSSSGAFSVDIPFTGPKLNAEISAPSYLPTRKVVLVTEGKADVGAVRLDRDTSIALESMTHLLTPKKDAQHLDLVVINERSKPVEVTSIAIDASRQLESRCADPSPGVIVNLKPDGKDTWTAELTSKDPSSASGRWTDAFPVSVRLETSGCENARLRFALPYSFDLAPAERAKIRLTLPRQVGSPAVVADFETWESVVVSLSLSDGTTVDRPWKR